MYNSIHLFGNGESIFLMSKIKLLFLIGNRMRMKNTTLIMNNEVYSPEIRILARSQIIT